MWTRRSILYVQIFELEKEEGQIENGNDDVNESEACVQVCVCLSQA